MNKVFLKFSKGRTFLVLTDPGMLRISDTPYFLFFEKDKMLAYFDIDNATEKTSFYALPKKETLDKYNIEFRYYHILLIQELEAKKFFYQKVLPLFKDFVKNEVDFLILIEKIPEFDSTVIDTVHKISSVFYNTYSKKALPVSYCPFNYSILPFSAEKSHKFILSLGNSRNFTISYLKNGEINISPNFGELDNLYELETMEYTIASLIEKENKEYLVVQEQDNYSVVNEVASRFAKFKKVKSVSHIFSHFANLLYDNKIDENVLCILFDNISYNSEDEIMGGEILYGNLKEMKIAGRWKPLPLPGGDIANIEPWRIALGTLKEITSENLENLDLPIVKNVKDNPHHSYIFNAINQKIVSYSLSSSMHHILAAIGELLFFEDNLKNFDYFELLVETSIENNSKEFKDLSISKKEDVYIIDTYQLFKKILQDIFSGRKKKAIFKNVLSSLVYNTLELIERLSKEYNTKKVGLTGEIFKHSHILNVFTQRLEKEGYEVLLPINIPLDDTAISVGQIIYTYYNTNSENQ